MMSENGEKGEMKQAKNNICATKALLFVNWNDCF